MEQIKITDWIQALVSLAAVVVALCAFYIARQTLHAPYRTLLKPRRILSEPTSDFRFGYEIFNYGPGIAYNILIKAPSSSTNSLSGKLEYDLRYSPDPTIIQPNEFGGIMMGNRVLLQLPFIIEYEILTGKKYREVWLYNQNGKFTRFNYFAAKKYIHGSSYKTNEYHFKRHKVSK
jgi:hypothetical protein